ncbi:fumarylacetoacetate hydrolase family protein [Novosphingobium sp. BL-52-GroH]|uniref:fumarylacetoacetate hydrolase family protein n=1 Tax=Novosphingobium sp. BL-52-GroH TaxID=3349877 RepID=UPI003850FAC0
MTEFHDATGLALGSFGFGTYAAGGRRFPGLVQPDGTLFDLSDRWHDTHAMLDDWDRTLDLLVEIAAKGGETGLRLDTVEPLPPLAHPNMLCAGANYRVHVAEMMTHNRFNQHNRQPGEDDAAFFARNLVEVDRRAREGMPFFWTSLHSALAGANATIPLPLVGDSHDWELEFGAVIARGGRHLRPDETNALVAGYVMCNDLGTVSEFRRTDVNWGYDWVSKHQPNFKPTGPFIVPKQFVKLDEVRILLKINGAVKQDWPISDMIFSVEQLLSYASERINLIPGDMLITGSPPGNGAMHGHFLNAGDVIESEIRFLGRQRNAVIAEDAQGRSPTYGKFPAT